MNRLALALLSLGLASQLYSAYEESYEPVLELPAPQAATLQPEWAARLNAQNSLEDSTAFGICVGKVEITPLAQQTADSQGQCSVAMAINCLTGKNLDDNDVDARYGYELLRALREECRPAGYTWKDGGEICPQAWELITHKIGVEGTPIVLALNGPEFSPSGRGHIVLVFAVNGDRVTFADPASGTTRTSTKQNMNCAPSHPQGNFIFYAERL